MLDADHHAVGVDVRRLELDDLGTSKPGAVGDAQRGLRLRIRRTGQDLCDLLGAQNHRQVLGLPHRADL